MRKAIEPSPDVHDHDEYNDALRMLVTRAFEPDTCVRRSF